MIAQERPSPTEAARTPPAEGPLSTPAPLPVAAPAPPAGTIARKRRAARGGATDSALSFESLRAEGLRLSQALSGQVWTDYNLHDPGVTMLEQLCYALTDLVYRADFPVADHLQADGEGGIDYPGLALHPPESVFPCRATSAADHRRVLLDQVPGLDDARLCTRAPGSAGVVLAQQLGVHRLQLKLAQGQVTGDDSRIAEARAAYRANRNLCEDIDAQVSLIGDAWCDLQLDIELSGPRNAVDVLADVYARCARHLTQGLTFHSLGEMQAAGLSLEQIYTGPTTAQGFARDGGGPPAELLFVSDLAALARAVDGVHEVRALALRKDGEDARSSALRWRGEDWALRLRVPGVSADLRDVESVRALLRREVRLRRRGSVVEVSPVELANRLADLYAASRTRPRGHATLQRPALPTGQHRDLQRYHSVQNDFPAVYGLGRHGIPPSATPQEKAQALQLKTYLVLFEQVMAHSAAQIEHLRDLYSPRDPAGPSHWWQMLDSAAVPGLDAIYLPPDLGEIAPGEAAARAASAESVRAHVQAEVYESRDARHDRKSRVLDHLLALHGETCTQNSMRQFCDYLATDELEQALLANKAGLLQDIVSLTRDRAAGLDYTQPAWDDPRGGTGLQRRVSHLLGFRHAHARPLTAALRRQKRTPRRVGDDRTLGPLDDAGGDTRAVPVHLPPVAREDMRADLSQLEPMRHPRLSEALLRGGLYRERYRLAGGQDDDADTPPAADRHRLLFGPDEAGRWWPLGEFDTVAAAARAAESQRRFLLHLNHESEGLHVVEHVLLRPVGPSPDHDRLDGLPADFYALRLTAVFPAWTSRCAQPNFRRLADETVQINCPAHVSARCLWLGFEALQRFEARWADWLQAKAAFCAAASLLLDEADADPAAAQRLNRAACRVIECLHEVWPTSSATAAAHA